MLGYLWPTVVNHYSPHTLPLRRDRLVLSNLQPPANYFFKTSRRYLPLRLTLHQRQRCERVNGDPIHPRSRLSLHDSFHQPFLHFRHHIPPSEQRWIIQVVENVSRDNGDLGGIRRPIHIRVSHPDWTGGAYDVLYVGVGLPVYICPIVGQCYHSMSFRVHYLYRMALNISGNRPDVYHRPRCGWTYTPP